MSPRSRGALFNLDILLVADGDGFLNCWLWLERAILPQLQAIKEVGFINLTAAPATSEIQIPSGRILSPDRGPIEKERNVKSIDQNDQDLLGGGTINPAHQSGNMSQASSKQLALKSCQPLNSAPAASARTPSSRHRALPKICAPAARTTQGDWRLRIPHRLREGLLGLAESAELGTP